MNAPSSQAAKLEATYREAVGHHQAGRLPEAERLYREILQFLPDHPETHHALGFALKDQGKMDEALAAFRKVAAVAPNSAAAHNNLGSVLFAQGHLEEAEASYRRAIALQPDLADALKNLGLVLVDRGRFADSQEWFQRYSKLAYGRPGGVPPEPAPPHKIKHDQEQREYVSGAAPGFFFHMEEGARIPGRAVNPDVDGKIAKQWETSTPQHVVIDNLLTDEALEALRRFCWRSTMWHKAHRNGYVGAMPEHGFACPLLVQINDEMRATYPTILGDYPLLRWWGFKYDSALRGINAHADFAAVNINFWIAPDDANLDPNSGGLVIWDKAAPLDWKFEQYNGAGQTVHDWLAEQGAKSIAVPHRANRAVVFDSDLFHATDTIAFKEGYLNRRINITLLYGRRGDAAAAKQYAAAAGAKQ